MNAFTSLPLTIALVVIVIALVAYIIYVSANPITKTVILLFEVVGKTARRVRNFRPRGKDKKPRKGHEVFAIFQNGVQMHYPNVKFASQCLRYTPAKLTSIIRGECAIPTDRNALKLVKYLRTDNVSYHPNGVRHDSPASAVVHEFDADLTNVKLVNEDGSEIPVVQETAERREERRRAKQRLQSMKCSPELQTGPEIVVMD